MLDGEVQTFTFEYRDPWEWILSLVQDESLAPINMWNSVRKYYCCGGLEEQIYDEPNTADTWWAIDVSFVCGSILVADSSFSLSQNFPRQTIYRTVTCPFIFGWIRVLLPNVYPSTQWSCILHGYHVKFEMHLGTEVESWLDICLW